MTTELKSSDQEVRKRRATYKGGPSDAVYGFGLIGAWVLLPQSCNHIWARHPGYFQRDLLARNIGL